ncbi:S9 family peptidase [Ciceribacter sp. RN22]|uniref:alpha/beta hydrolase family protein n=1 Tax=Ciceribacter sp. RN22 TaxID=2954932 RepID=UPI002092548A|nr:alpha/beta fold hydrolase [Ciceribacter sp. RN22]MCO6180975.1 lysophospholipase [Ciceribacter sp. RN22]
MIYWRILFFLATAMAALAPLIAAANELKWNGPADRNDCPLGDNAVWVEFGAGEGCIRYFVGGEVRDATTVLVFLRGDRDDWAKLNPDDIPLNSVEGQESLARKMAEKTGLPTILLERPGTFGSSGNVWNRRLPGEYLAVDAALDQLRQRYRIARFVLLGHSGGATLAAGLMTLGRKDISCAVLTSGAFALTERARLMSLRNGWQMPSNDYLSSLYDPLDHVDGIVPDPDREIIVIGNTRDSNTPFAFQERFVQAVRARGHRIRLIDYPAAEPRYHNLKDQIGIKIAAECGARS